MLTPDDATLVTFQQMEVELSRFQKENNILELKVVEEHKKLKAKEQEMIMERTKVSYDLSVT